MPVVRVAECTGPATHLRADMIPIIYKHTHSHSHTRFTLPQKLKRVAGKGA